MKFEDIFEQQGLYKAQDFAEGFCYEIDENGFLSSLQYRDKNDILPIRENPLIYKRLFDKNFTKVYNRNQLFNKNNNHAK